MAYAALLSNIVHCTAARAAALAIALAAVGAPGEACAAPGEFSDEWFFSGAERPKELRSLEGQPAPELATSEWIGASTSLESVRGKVVVVDFWATWCGPCMAAIPKNVELMKKHGDAGLIFVGMHDGSSGWDKAAGVVRDKGINYPVAKDSGESVKRYKLQFWPTYVVIDRAGVVRAAGLLPDKVGAVVETLLAEAPPPGFESASAAGNRGPGFPAEWYVGGAARPKWISAAEGKPAPKLLDIGTVKPGAPGVPTPATPAALGATVPSAAAPPPAGAATVPPTAPTAPTTPPAPRAPTAPAASDAPATPASTDTPPAPSPADRWFNVAPREEDLAQRIIVMQFLAPESEISLKQFDDLQKLAAQLGPQGVTFVGVCDARSDWTAAKAIFEKRGFTLPIVRDAPSSIVATAPSGAPGATVPGAPAAPAGAGSEFDAMLEEGMPPEVAMELAEMMKNAAAGAVVPMGLPGAAVPGAPVVATNAVAKGPAPRGATAFALGVRLIPLTFVVGRDGNVFAAGIKGEKLGDAIGKALATSG